MISQWVGGGWGGEEVEEVYRCFLKGNKFCRTIAVPRSHDIT